MIKTIIGLILLLIPFLLIDKFKTGNKKLGFFYILSFLIGFHLFVAIITQTFGIFNYWVILLVNIVVGGFVLYCVCFRGGGLNGFGKIVNNLKKIKIDWMLVFVILVLGVMLYSVHYNYTGKVSTAVEGIEVENMRYNYPYYSDEWSAVSLIQYSIDSGKLPLINPLWPEYSFPNFELPFHSFLSEIMLLLGLNPLTQYTILSFFSGLLICLLVYFVLRVNRVKRFPSAIACLSIPFIINGANLPGIWDLIPIVLGVISLLLLVLFMSINNKKMILFTAFLSLIFYPPLAVLIGPSLLCYFMFAKIKVKRKIQYLGLFLGIGLFVTVVLSLFVFFTKGSFGEFASYVFSKIFYPTFTTSVIPDYAIWKVIPILSLFFAGIGVFKIWRKRVWLIFPVVIGLIYWVIYSNVLWRFIIEYQRVVFSTSILIVLLSGFGIHYFIEFLKTKEVINEFKIINWLIFLVLAFFFIFAFFYTQNEDWMDLKAYSVVDNQAFTPASPVNNYLHEDDLRLFEGVSEKKFLSIPWKGLVVGVATNNYPLETKPSTITNDIFSSSEFIKMDCDDKSRIIQKKKIDYVYLNEINCKGFELVGVSMEGFYLYDVSLLEI